MDQDPQLSESSSGSDSEDYQFDQNNDLNDYQERFHQQWLLNTDLYLGRRMSRGDRVMVNQNIDFGRNPFFTFQSQPNSIEIYYLRNLNEAPETQFGLWKNILADNAKPLFANGLIYLLGRLIYYEINEEEVKKKCEGESGVKSKQIDKMLKENRKKQELAQSQQNKEQRTKQGEKKQHYSKPKSSKQQQSRPGSIFGFRVNFALTKTAFELDYTPTIKQDDQYYYSLIKNFQKVYKKVCYLIQDIDNDAQEVLKMVERGPTTQNQQQDQDVPDDLFTNNNIDFPETNIEPELGLREDLRPHQKQALTWLLYREGVGNWHPENQVLSPIWQQYQTKKTEENQDFYFCPFTGQNSRQNASYTGGILADDNGFDEKLTMIALILSNPQPPQGINQQQIKTTLIVTSNQIINWQRTFELCNLQVLVHIWDNEVLNFQNYDVVIVTYHTLMEDWKRKQQFDTPSIYDYNYYRVILDQSSKIQNFRTKRAQSCLSLKAHYRWCVTSQSLVQNDFMDLVAVSQFINQKQMPCPNYWWFNKYIKTPYRWEINRQAVKSILKNIWGPLILRRTQEARYANGNRMIIIPLINRFNQIVQLDQNERNAYLMMQNQLGEHQYYRYSSKLRKICDYAQMADIRPVVDRINQRKLQQLMPQATNQERQIFQDQVLNELRNLQICPVCQNEVARFMVSSCGHYLCKRCYRERREAQNLDQCPNCQQPNTRYISVIYTLNNEWRNNYIRSTKINRIREILLQIPAGEKCVIFTQFLEMIHVLHHDFTTDQHPIECYQIHGAMPYEQRILQLNLFNQAQGTVVLIASLKANEGQDLTRASHVIFVEPWWNFSVQDQAIQRVLVNHRGVFQNDEISVHKLIAEETIDVRIYELNEERRELLQDQLIQDEQEIQDEEDDSDSDQD